MPTAKAWHSTFKSKRRQVQLQAPDNNKGQGRYWRLARWWPTRVETILPTPMQVETYFHALRSCPDLCPKPIREQQKWFAPPGRSPDQRGQTYRQDHPTPPRLPHPRRWQHYLLDTRSTVLPRQCLDLHMLFL